MRCMTAPRSSFVKATLGISTASPDRYSGAGRLPGPFCVRKKLAEAVNTFVSNPVYMIEGT